MRMTSNLSADVYRYRSFKISDKPAWICGIDGNIIESNPCAVSHFDIHSNNIDELFCLSHWWDSQLTLPQYVVGESLIGVSVGELYILCISPFNEYSWLIELEQMARCPSAHQSVQEHALFYDAQTHLSSYRVWLAQVNQSSSLTPHTIAILKLNNLRYFNQSHGLVWGDYLLNRISEYFAKVDPKIAQAYRFFGAKFLVVINEPVESLTKWLVEELPSLVPNELMLSLKRSIHLDWQVGGTEYSQTKQPLELLEECLVAMSFAKPSRLVNEYSDTYPHWLTQYEQTQSRVYLALENESLDLWLQPQVTADGSIVGFEGLGRLVDEQKNIISPNDFLPFVDKNNWYSWLACLVVERAAQLINEWDEALPDVPISINLAGPELLDAYFFNKLLSMYQQSELITRRLAIELTETSIVAQLDETKHRLNQLIDQGVVVLIDDFGTGHASLAQLIDLPARTLKIDQLFVAHIVDSGRHANIINATLQLAKSLSLNVVAEGVSSQEQLDCLKDMGCEIFQGFLFSKPQPYTSWLAQAKS